MDLDVDFDRKKPNYVTNFFGLGNETIYRLPEQGINYYRVRYKQTVLKTLLRSKIGNFANLYFGPTYQNIEVENTPGRFISDFSLNRLEANTFEKKYYAGANVGILLDKRDNAQIPTEGIVLNIDGNLNKGLKPASSDFGQISSSLALYFTFRTPAQITTATRIGAGKSFGGYEFFQSQILSGNTNLRGFRKTRFAGESNVFHNFELRMKLFTLRSYLFPAQVGLIGFNDIGRVWQQGEQSSQWHHGYGGGLYIAPLNKVVLSAVVGFSREDVLPLVKAGFLF
jgi:outer membrane protein assembly factor BamA